MPGTIAAPNITPDKETGIGAWTDGEKIRGIREFVSRFKAYNAYVEKGAPKVTPSAFTLMPWLNLAQLPPEDLKAI